MKKITVIFLAAVLCMTFSSCGKGDKEDIITEETVTTQTEWDNGPPEYILNTDFRNIVWGMTPAQIAYQEQRYEDYSGDYLIIYDNVKFGGFDSRLYYYFDDSWGCTSAAYIITLSADSPSYETAYDIVDKFITGMFAPPDEEGGSVRTTRTAVIELTSEDTGIERIISVKFSKPEDYDDEKYYSKVIYFDNGEPVGSSVYP